MPSLSLAGLTTFAKASASATAPADKTAVKKSAPYMLHSSWGAFFEKLFSLCLCELSGPYVGTDCS
jgi:hypothetical protein